MSQVLFAFPGVVTSGISFPFDEVYVSSSLSFVSDYCFYFIFVFSLNKVRWRTQVVSSVDVIFVIW